MGRMRMPEEEGSDVATVGAPNTAYMSHRDLDALYWRAVYAERDRTELETEIAEERSVARKRIGHLERDNTKLKRLLKDASSRLKAMREALEAQEHEIAAAIKAAGMGGSTGEGAEDDPEHELQRYHDAIKRIEGSHGGFRRSDDIPINGQQQSEQQASDKHNGNEDAKG